MSAVSDKKWADATAGLPPELRAELNQLREDYTEAARIHVPNWTGGPNADILAELISVGWRKR